MPSFGDQYSQIYDSFYAKKDYKEEMFNLSDFLYLNGFSLTDKNILEIGCGSGKFTQELAKQNLVRAIDKSEQMIAQARSNYPSISHIFTTESITSVKEEQVRLEAKNYDVVILLFHVFSYLSISEIEDLRTLCSAGLKENGLLIFDFWDTLSVKEIAPETRVRESIHNQKTVIRVANPSVTYHMGTPVKVSVKYDFYAKEKESLGMILFSESHEMHCYTLDKIRGLFPKMNLIGSWDIVNNKPSNLQTYGNTVVLQNSKA